LELTYSLKVWFMARFPHMSVVWPIGIMSIKFPKASQSPTTAHNPLADSPGTTSSSGEIVPLAQMMRQATSGSSSIAESLKGRVKLLESAFKTANPY